MIVWKNEYVFLIEPAQHKTKSAVYGHMHND